MNEKGRNVELREIIFLECFGFSNKRTAVEIQVLAEINK